MYKNTILEEEVTEPYIRLQQFKWKIAGTRITKWRIIYRLVSFCLFVCLLRRGNLDCKVFSYFLISLSFCSILFSKQHLRTNRLVLWFHSSQEMYIYIYERINKKAVLLTSILEIAVFLFYEGLIHQLKNGTDESTHLCLGVLSTFIPTHITLHSFQAQMSHLFYHVKKYFISLHMN